MQYHVILTQLLCWSTCVQGNSGATSKSNYCCVVRGHIFKSMGNFWNCIRNLQIRCHRWVGNIQYYCFNMQESISLIQLHQKKKKKEAQLNTFFDNGNNELWKLFPRKLENFEGKFTFSGMYIYINFASNPRYLLCQQLSYHCQKRKQKQKRKEKKQKTREKRSVLSSGVRLLRVKHIIVLWE